MKHVPLVIGLVTLVIITSFALQLLPDFGSVRSDPVHQEFVRQLVDRDLQRLDEVTNSRVAEELVRRLNVLASELTDPVEQNEILREVDRLFPPYPIPVAPPHSPRSAVPAGFDTHP